MPVWNGKHLNNMQWFERGPEMVHNEKGIYGFFGDYRWLSNFHEAWINYEGILYRSTENAYQAAKTLDVSQKQMMADQTPSIAKKIGRNGLVLREDWDQVKNQIMLEINLIKYTQHTALKEKLLATGDKYLEETNWWKDTYWGVCNGVGENNLGKILMVIRKDLKNLK